METLQTSAATLVFWLTVWVKQVATCMSKLLSSFGTSWQELVEIFQNVSSVTSIFWRQVCEFLCGIIWATEQLYQDLLNCMKKAVPFLQGVDDQQIVISYEDLSLQTFINIDRNESTRKYSTNSTTSGVETVHSFQPGFPGKYVLRWRNLFTILDTVWGIIQPLLRFVPVLNQTCTG